MAKQGRDFCKDVAVFGRASDSSSWGAFSVSVPFPLAIRTIKKRKLFIHSSRRIAIYMYYTFTLAVWETGNRYLPYE